MLISAQPDHESALQERLFESIRGSIDGDVCAVYGVDLMQPRPAIIEQSSRPGRIRSAQPVLLGLRYALGNAGRIGPPFKVGIQYDAGADQELGIHLPCDASPARRPPLGLVVHGLAALGNAIET